jgi:hypothetical protein
VLYQLSYLGTVFGKESEALLQDSQRKIKLPGHPNSERVLKEGCGGMGGIYFPELLPCSPLKSRESRWWRNSGVIFPPGIL